MRKLFSMMALVFVSILFLRVGTVNAVSMDTSVVLDLTYYNEVELDLNKTTDPFVSVLGGLVDTTKATSFWTFDDSTLSQGNTGDKIKVTYDSATNKAKIVLNIAEPEDGAVVKNLTYNGNTVTLKYGYVVQEISDIYINDIQFYSIYDGLVPKIAGEEGTIFTAVSNEPDKYYVYIERWTSNDGKTFTSSSYFNNDGHTNGGADLLTKFEYGKTYGYSIWIKPAEGYKFADDVEIHAGSFGHKYSSLIDGDNDDTGVTFNFNYNFEAFRLVKSIKLDGFNTPIIGEKITNQFTIKLYGFDGKEIAPDNYTIDSVEWYIKGTNDDELIEFPAVFESGKEYYALVEIEINDDYFYDDEITDNIDCKNLDNNYTNRHARWIQIYSKDMTAIVAPNYKIIEGGNSSYTIDSNIAITIKADGDFTKFVGIEVDGTTASTDKYTAVSGSTVITLKPEYLNTLSIGKHTMKIVYNDGDVTTNFTILAKAEETPKNPQTLDNISWYMTLGCISLIGLLSSGLYLKKKMN